jgi:hypothetical protein
MRVGEHPAARFRGAGQMQRRAPSWIGGLHKLWRHFDKSLHRAEVPSLGGVEQGGLGRWSLPFGHPGALGLVASSCHDPAPRGGAQTTDACVLTALHYSCDKFVLALYTGEC